MCRRGAAGLLRDLTWDGVELARPDGTAERLRPEAVARLSLADQKP